VASGAAPGNGARVHGDLVARSTLTVFGSDDPALLIRVLGPIAAQTVPVESVSILRTEDDPLVHIVLVLRTGRGVAETIARRIGRLVDVARVNTSPEY
jgi:acetolactate synthase small subunit